MWVSKKDDGTFDVEIKSYVSKQAECIALALEHNGLCTNTFSRCYMPEIVLLTFNFETRSEALSFCQNCKLV